MSLYCAYGSNMNIEQMNIRCPEAVVIGTGFIPNYLLMFRGRYDSAVATIQSDRTSERGKSKGVPVVVWDITPNDEKALDRYEGYPDFYKKDTVKVLMNDGKTLETMVYIMNEGYGVGVPSGRYFNTILEGYHDNNIDSEYLFKRLEAATNMWSSNLKT